MIAATDSYTSDLFTAIKVCCNAELVEEIYTSLLLVDECESILDMVTVSLSRKKIVFVLNHIVFMKKMELLKRLNCSSSFCKEGLLMMRYKTTINCSNLMSQYSGHLICEAIKKSNLNIFNFALKEFQNSQSSECWFSFDNEKEVMAISKENFKLLVMTKFFYDIATPSHRVTDFKPYSLPNTEIMLMRWRKSIASGKLHKINEYILSSLLLNNFPLTVPFSSEVIGKLRSGSSIRVYVNRPDLRECFSEEMKMAGKEELAKRKEEVRPYIASDDIVNYVVGKFL